VFTPFPSLLAAPASFVLGTSLVTPGVLGRNLILWSGATAFTVWWMFRRVISTVTINGG
jgi:ABC-type uncharacterized transport system permease subunit